MCNGNSITWPYWNAYFQYMPAWFHVLSDQKILKGIYILPKYNCIFFNFQNVTYIQNEGFPTAVLATTPPPNAVQRQYMVRGGTSKCYLQNGLFTK